MDRLLTLCKNGDRFARGELYTRYVDKAFGLALRVLRNRESAKDAIQQVFVKVFTNIDQFRSESEVGTWIYRITMNICLDQLRYERKGFVSIDSDAAGIDRNGNLSTEPDQEKSPLEEVVRKILKTIDKEWAKTFWLFTMEQVSQKEIAEIQKVSLPTVKMRLARVRKLLKEQLEAKTV